MSALRPVWEGANPGNVFAEPAARLLIMGITFLTPCTGGQASPSSSHANDSDCFAKQDICSTAFGDCGAGFLTTTTWPCLQSVTLEALAKSCHSYAVGGVSPKHQSWPAVEMCPGHFE